jgi:hypothetical protein
VLIEAARVHEAYVAGETLAVRVAYGIEADDAREAVIEDRPLLIGARRAGH